MILRWDREAPLWGTQERGHGDDFYSETMKIWDADSVVRSSDLEESKWESVIMEIQKVPELIQGLFASGIRYLGHMLILVFFDQNPQYLHQRSKWMIFVLTNHINQII
jgi:hypothetical protein